MQDLPHRNRSNGSSSEWGENRTPTNYPERTTGEIEWQDDQHKQYQELIAKANTVPLILILAKYHIRIDQTTNKITCPFKFHSNGQERTASFYYYHNDNSFWCFGCKTGRKPTDFVSAYDNISRTKAARKILHLFESNVSDDWETAACNTQEKQEQIVSFSKKVRSSILAHPDKIKEIEMITEAFDLINEKHDLDTNGLNLLVDRLSEKLPV
jgi:CHC2 zinc finger